MKTLNTKPLSILLISLTILTSSCFRDGITGIRGSGPIVSEEVYPDEFTGIDLRISGDVIITKGDQLEVIIEAQQNIINNIMHRVRGGIWNIEFDRNVKNHDGITIFIIVPEIEELEISGSGDITSTSDFVTNNLDLSISGSGNISFEIEAKNVYSHISGSGNVNLRGSTDNHNAHISGSGSINTFSLISDNCDINISGSGNTNVYVTDNLDVEISGSGSVYYKGYPSVFSNISGSGNIGSMY